MFLNPYVFKYLILIILYIYSFYYFITVLLSMRLYSCDVKELSSSQNSERSKFKSKNIIERRLIY